MGFGNLLGGIGNALGKGAGAVGSGIGQLFNGVSQGYGSMNPRPSSGAGTALGTSSGGGSSFGKMFGNPLALGIGGLVGSQLIGNAKTPKLPQSFTDFQNQANAGGPPIQQQSNAYMQGILNGTNTNANDAATHSLDLNYQEQLRQLNGMYKSLRPGTDPTSDTTYQRDLNNLNDMYARQRAQVLAQQQQGAAQYGLQAGQAQAGQQAQALDTQVNQIAQQWQMDQAKRENLRNLLLGLGGNSLQYGMISKLFPNAFSGGMNGK